MLSDDDAVTVRHNVLSEVDRPAHYLDLVAGAPYYQRPGDTEE
ncbi:hypothetical protein [Mycobacterium simiae]|nr:hypothetical protein [Mycobacterium simiae]PLV44939.1 hypothetical protein X011_25620 [Mycobacterium tuberculosis variant microti OV254]